VLSPGALLGTAAALGILTALTVALGHVDLGALNVAVALAIASLKATLVALYFMHLRWGARFHLVVLGGAVAFAVLLIAFVVFDSTEYQPDVRAAARAAASKAPAGEGR
jgi:cytochrome c oxidase subunit 4